MTRWQTVYRWVGAVLGVGVLALVLVLVFGHEFGSKNLALGPTQRRINTIVDLGDDGTKTCDHPELHRGDPPPHGVLRSGSTACVLVGAVDDGGILRWFFLGRATGTGTVRVPKPVQVGHTEVALTNGAVVSLGSTVTVRCSPDPNERFESWIATGRATAGYLNATGALVAIDCTTAANA